MTDAPDFIPAQETPDFIPAEASAPNPTAQGAAAISAAPPGAPRPQVNMQESSPAQMMGDAAQSANENMDSAQGDDSTPGGAAGNMASGLLKGAEETAHTILAVGSKIPGSGGDIPFEEPKYLQAKNPSQVLGKGLEGLVEFVASDGLLKGLTSGQRLKVLSQLVDSAEQSPFVMKIVSAGLKSLREGSLGAGVVGTAQGLAHGEDLPTALESGATTGITAGIGSAVMNSAAKAVSGRAPAIEQTIKEAIADSRGAAPLAKDEAGANAKQANENYRIAKGKELGAAKQELKKTLPTNVKTDDEYKNMALSEKQDVPTSGFSQNEFRDKKFEDLKPKQKIEVLKRADQIKTEETGQMPFPSEGEASQRAKDILQTLGSEGADKLGLSDPNSPLGRMMSKISRGKNPNGQELSFSFDEAETARRSLSDRIRSEGASVRQGGDGTLYRKLIDFKKAFDNDLWDTWGKYGDDVKAGEVRRLGKEYASIITNKYSGPAKTLFNASSPSKIVNQIAGGSMTPEALDSFSRNLTEPQKTELGKSALGDMYRTSPMQGTQDINMATVQQKYYKAQDHMRTLLGNAEYGKQKEFIDAAAKAQVTKNSIHLSPAQKVALGAAKVASAGALGAVGEVALGPIGGFAGTYAGKAIGDTIAEKIAKSVFEQGKAGQMKLGISPTEQIVMTPAQANSQRPVITRFLKAMGTRDFPAMVSAYKLMKNAEQGGQYPTHVYNPQSGVAEPL